MSDYSNVAPLSAWQRWVRRLVWGYAALIALIALLIHFTGDGWWLGTLLMFGPRWVWAAPLLPLVLIAVVPISVASLRERLPPLLTAAALLAVPIMGWNLHFGSTPRVEPSDLRLLTYNIGTDQVSTYTTIKLSNLRWLVDFVHADIALFQECNFSEEDLKVAFPEYDVNSAFDACLVTRYVVSKSDLRDREDIRALGGSGVIDRFELLTPRGPVSLLNVHLETVRKGLEQILNNPLGLPAALANNIRLRRVESSAALHWAARATGPQIIAGDFNMPQNSRIYQAYWRGYGNALADCGNNGFQYTKFSGKSGIRIDHVLYDSKFECTSAYVLSPLGGDHRPVVATLRLR
jgi:endonuclease/exonuclease/phosphatase (EEP) superfamily protein YafD